MTDIRQTLWRVYDARGEYLGKVGDGYAPLIPTTQEQAQRIAESVFGPGATVAPTDQRHD